MKHEKMKKLTVLAMLSAIAYVAVALLRFPVVLFLSYEPKDVVIAIGGFLYGPLAALGISLVVSFIEMLTISSTGWIGFVMNFLSSAAFAGTAALLYRKKRTQGSAIAGLFGGALLMTVLMLLWNYLITPLYMHTARADVAAMLVPVFLPFNLLKGCLNATITSPSCRDCAMRTCCRRAKRPAACRSSAVWPCGSARWPFWPCASCSF